MIKKKFPTAFAPYFATIVIVYSIYDYIEHITREGSVFSQFPIDWLLFSTASITSILLIVLGVKFVLEKIFSAKNLGFELVSIGIWLIIHLNILGPLFDQYLWPHTDLFFQFKFSGVLVILSIYFIIRVIVNFLLKKPFLEGY